MAQVPTAMLIVCSFDKQVHGDVDILFYFMGITVDIIGSSEVGHAISRGVRKYYREK